jgi:hypothetical protein
MSDYYVVYCTGLITNPQLLTHFKRLCNDEVFKVATQISYLRFTPCR